MDDLYKQDSEEHLFGVEHHPNYELTHPRLEAYPNWIKLLCVTGYRRFGQKYGAPLRITKAKIQKCLAPKLLKNSEIFFSIWYNKRRIIEIFVINSLKSFSNCSSFKLFGFFGTEFCSTCLSNSAHHSWYWR